MPGARKRQFARLSRGPAGCSRPLVNRPSLASNHVYRGEPVARPQTAHRPNGRPIGLPLRRPNDGRLA